LVFRKPVYQKFRALAVISIGLMSLPAGHSAFSAGLQPTDDLAHDFAAPEEPLTLSDIPLTLDGKPVVLAKEAPGLILLNVWATWCGPCVEEMPSLDRLEAELGSDRFQVVTVSMGQDMDKVGPFFEKEGIKALKPYIDKSGDFSRAMGALGLPVSYLIKDGKVLRQIVGPADWASAEAKAIIQAEM
jgi:thiol-disulfide isomerase/thioredoxin